MYVTHATEVLLHCTLPWSARDPCEIVSELFPGLPSRFLAAFVRLTGHLDHFAISHHTVLQDTLTYN